MNDQVRQALRDILAKHGTEVCSDAKRCAGLLGDYCGSNRREINILVNALEERVPLELLAAGTMPRELLLSRLARRLEEQLGMTEVAALWAVETWAWALNVITEGEVKERENNRANARSRNAEAANINGGFAVETKSKEDESTIYPTLKAPGKTPPAQQPAPVREKPPVLATPPTAPTVQPSGSIINRSNQAPIKPHSGGKNVARANQTQSSDPNVRPRAKARSNTFRGCFVGCLLIIILLSILFVGIPYAIQVMRQTQQPSIEDQQRPQPQ